MTFQSGSSVTFFFLISSVSMLTSQIKIVNTCILHTLKAQWGTVNWLWSSLNLLLVRHILPTSANETISEEMEITILSVTMSLPGLLSQRKHFITHRLKEMICWLRAWSIRCSLLYCQRLEAGGYFSLHNFSILCLWSNWYCRNKWSVSFTLFRIKCSR